MSPEQARALAVQLLAASGFELRARNARGDSFYLARPGSPWAIRVSNHARTPKQRRNHPEVATSLVIHGARSPAQVAAMVSQATAAHARAANAQAAAEP